MFQNFLGSSQRSKINTIRSLEHLQHKKALVKNDHKIFLTDNTCVHRQAIMVHGEQVYSNTLTCPLHGWTYNQKGELLGEPAGFYSKPPCLETKEPYAWNGLLWESKPDIDLDSIPFPEYLNPDKFIFHSSFVEKYTFDWKIFVEIVLDSYHVSSVHPGLSNFVDMSTYSQISGHGFAYQSTKLTKNLFKNPSANFSAWQNYICKSYHNRFEFASMWLVLYPNVIIEYYPGTCVVGHVYPNSNGCEFYYEFYYEDDIAAFDQEFIRLQQSSYNEACIEDELICNRIQLGRHDLSKCYTHALESQIDHWYDYIKVK